VPESRAAEQLDAADEVGALPGRLAPPSQLIQVFDRLERRRLTSTTSTDASQLFRPLVVVAFAVGGASLIANIVWNCSSCGWDLDRVPWYQALLVAAVPFVISPLGMLGLAIRSAFLRSRPALLELAGGSAGLVLPWLFYFIAYIRDAP
jgi:hypothetical protein